MCRKSSTFLSISQFHVLTELSAMFPPLFCKNSATPNFADSRLHSEILMPASYFFRWHNISGKTTNQTYCRDLLMLKIISWGVWG